MSKPSEPVMDKRVGSKDPGLFSLCRDDLFDIKICLVKFPFLMLFKEACADLFLMVEVMPKCTTDWTNGLLTPAALLHPSVTGICDVPVTDGWRYAHSWLAYTFIAKIHKQEKEE